VEATVVGEFTSSGLIEVFHGQDLVGLLRLSFLHDGLPRMELKARWEPPHPADDGVPPRLDLKALALNVLADPNVASREEWVRQYDHEVQGRSVVKPFVGRGRDAPSDGAVLKVRYDSWKGLTVTHGICPWYGDSDTYDMAQCAVDEAVRAHVALGGDPDAMFALDNFCWPDPVEAPDNPDGAFKLAQLVRACQGLADACAAFALPLISGKDSMKNDARIGGRKVSVRPTLLISLMGTMPDIRKSVTTDFKERGDAIYLLGETRGELGCTRFERAAGKRLGRGPSVHVTAAVSLYRQLYRAIQDDLVRSCHDLSDGGLWVSLAESCLGGCLGAHVDLDMLPVAVDCLKEPARLLFAETPSRLLVSVSKPKEREWLTAMRGVACARIGEVTAVAVRVRAGGRRVLDLPLRELAHAWKGGQR